MILQLAWRNLWRNRTRTFIMIGATLFAVLIAIMMRSVQEGMYNRQIDNMVIFNTGYIQLQNKLYWDERTIDNSFEVSNEIKTSLETTNGITAYSPRIESGALIASDSVSKPVAIIAVDPEGEGALTQLDEKVVEGEYFKKGDSGILLGKTLAEKLKVSVGDTVVFIGGGYHGNSAAGKYHVAGLLNFGLPMLNKTMVYMTISEAQNFLSAPNLVSVIAMNLENTKDMPMVQDELISKIDTSSIAVLNFDQMMPELLDGIEADRGGGVIMLYVLYMIIGFVILGTLLMMVKERMREFSMLIALGMHKIQIGVTLLLECFFMALLGAAGGILLSFPGTFALQENPVPLEGPDAEMYEMMNFEAVITAQVDPTIMLDQTIVVTVISLVLSIIPFVKVMAIDPVKGMKE